MFNPFGVRVLSLVIHMSSLVVRISSLGRLKDSHLQIVLEAASMFAEVLRQLAGFWLLGNVAAVPVESRVEWCGCLTYV